MDANLITTETFAALLAAIAAFAAVASLLLPHDADPKLSARLQKLARERGQLREARLAELAAPGKSKVRIEPHSALKAIGSALRGRHPSDAEESAQRLTMAGFRGPNHLGIYLFMRAALPPVAFAGGFLLAILWPGSDASLTSALFTAITAAAVGAGLPRFVLARLIARRQRAISRAFPDALDLMLICVQSGMSVEVALARVTKDIFSQSVELAEELSVTMAELAYLPARWKAYHNLGQRTGLPAIKLVAAALSQAERYGTSISQALVAAARECRETQIADAEQKAAALPPKLSVPLVVFFVPVLLTVILGPALINASEVFRANGSMFTNRPAIPQAARTARGPGVYSTAPQVQELAP